MSNARDVLDFEGHALWPIDAQSTVLDATELMEDKRIGALPVTDGTSALAGVLSERDCARATILRGLSAGNWFLRLRRLLRISGDVGRSAATPSHPIPAWTLRSTPPRPFM